MYLLYTRAHGLVSIPLLQTLALIPLYARIEPSDPDLAVSIPSTSEDPAHAAQVERGEDEEFDFPSSLVLFSETRKADVSTRFRKEADAYYVEAKRSTVSSIAQVPVWMYGVMVALGWNEFLAVVRSPLYFTFLLLLLASAYGECRFDRVLCRLSCLRRRAETDAPLQRSARLLHDLTQSSTVSI